MKPFDEEVEDLLRSLDGCQSDKVEVAKKIRALYNSKPRSPTLEEIVAVLNSGSPQRQDREWKPVSNAPRGKVILILHRDGSKYVAVKCPQTPGATWDDGCWSFLDEQVSQKEYFNRLHPNADIVGWDWITF